MKTKTEYDWITCSYCGYLYGKNSYMYKTNHYIRNLVLSWSPDHERQLTFRSQKTDDLIIIIVDQSQVNRRPAVNFLARSGDRREQAGRPAVKPTRSVWRPARTEIVETGENKVFTILESFSAGRCRICRRFCAPVARAQFACRGRPLCTYHRPSGLPRWLQSGLPSPHQFCTQLPRWQ